MTTSGISALGSTYAYGTSTSSGAGSIRQQRHQDFANLASALKSGDLSAAQDAFAAIQKNMQQVAGASSSSSTGDSGTNPMESLGKALESGDISSAQNIFSQMTHGAQGGRSSGGHHEPPEVQQLSQALQSGDLEGAKQAFSALQQMMQQRHAGGDADGDNDGSTSSTTSTSAASSTSSTSSSSSSDLIKKLSDALNSGDLSSAQDAFSQLQTSARSHRMENPPPDMFGGGVGSYQAVSATAQGTDLGTMLSGIMNRFQTSA